MSQDGTVVDLGIPLASTAGGIYVNFTTGVIYYGDGYTIYKASPTCDPNSEYNNSPYCDCLPGFSRPSNSLSCLPTCYGIVQGDAGVCNGHGSCDAVDTCRCNSNWGGFNCSMPKCFGILQNSTGVCNDHGSCDAVDTCVCNSNWGGSSCSLPKCFGILQNSTSVCNGHGSCDAVDTCVCNSNWGGFNCSMPKCFGLLQNSSSVCNGHGSCNTVDTCVCNSNWGGSICSLPKCFGILQNETYTVCNGHGSCNNVDTCVCNSNWGGSDCSMPKCFGILANSTISVCSGRGLCIAPDTCNCNVGYFGTQCQNLVNNSIISNNASCWGSLEMGAPKPQIVSQIVNGDGIQFSLNFSVDPNVEFSHFMRIGENSSFNADSCVLSGGEGVNLTLVTSGSPCFKVYSSQVFSLDYLMSNPNVKKESIGDLVKLTIPIALYYFDVLGINNGGFCRAYEFTTSQVIYVQLTSTVISSFNENSSLDPYTVNLYPQGFSTDPSTGLLQVQMILRVSNVTLTSFNFYNTTNPNYIFQVSATSFLYQNGLYAFYQIRMHSNVKVNDYRALTFFTATLKRNGIIDDVIQYIPLKIDYTIVEAPSDKNFTLQPYMYLAGSDWSPKTIFKTGEKVFAQVQSSSTLGKNHLLVNDAYLCCFKTFTPTLSYNPSQGEYGCSQFNSGTMDVWKPIISSKIGNSELETQLFPYPGAKTLYGFSFTLISSMFPQKHSNSSASTSCFVQSNVGVTPLTRSVAATSGDMSTASTMFVVQVVTSAKESSSRVSGGSSLSVGSVLMAVVVMTMSAFVQALFW